MKKTVQILLVIVAAVALYLIPHLGGRYLSNSLFKKLGLEEPKSEAPKPFQEVDPSEKFKPFATGPDGIKNTLVASNQESFLGKSFKEIVAKYGMCILDESGKQPLRSNRAWSDILPDTGTAQAEWRLSNGLLVSVVWLPPGSESPSALVKVEAMTTFTPQEIEELLLGEAPSAWQRRPTNAIMAIAEKTKPDFAKKLNAAEVDEFTLWRMDNSSVKIRQNHIIIKGPKITRQEVEMLSQP